MCIGQRVGEIAIVRVQARDLRKRSRDTGIDRCTVESASCEALVPQRLGNRGQTGQANRSVIRWHIDHERLVARVGLVAVAIDERQLVDVVAPAVMAPPPATVEPRTSSELGGSMLAFGPPG